MSSAFRPAMAWLHTWFGLVLGYVLMVCFCFGSLSVFDREIDRWALPETRFAPQPMPSFDRLLAPAFAQMTPDADELAAARGRIGAAPVVTPARAWAAYTTHRDPVLRMVAEFGVANNPRDADDHVHGEITIDPRTAKVLPHDQLKAVCIATGFVFFVEKRKRRHAAHGQMGARWADAMAVTTVTGMLVATLAMLVANRALPVDLADRSHWQKGLFWAAWVAAFFHAAWRTAPVARARLAPAWADHCVAVATLAAAAVGLNWLTTGDYLLKTVMQRNWPIAGVDAVLLATAGLAAVAAVRLRRRERARSALPRTPSTPVRVTEPTAAGA